MADLFIFGASIKGQMALDELRGEFNVVGFLDNATAKRGTSFCGLPVLALPDYLEHHRSAEIAIASQYDDEIVDQLIENGLFRFSVYNPGFRARLDGVQERSLFHYDMSMLDGRRVDQVALVAENYSGSNTLCLYKSGLLEQAGLKQVLFHSADKGQHYIEALLTTRLLVTTHGARMRRGKTVQLWHGFPLKGLNLMSRYQTPAAMENTSALWRRFSAIASYSQTYTTLLNACHGVPVDKYHITGMPRNDFLFAAQARQWLQEVSGRNLSSLRVAFYLPTFRKTVYGQVNGVGELGLFGFPRLDLERLFRFLEAQGILLVVKPHPYHEDDFGMGPVAELPESVCVLNERMLLEHERDLYELLGAADLLITDYSSVYFDYLLLDRPILFTPGDLEAYRETRGFLLEPYDFWAPGPKCLDQESFEQALARAVEEPQWYREERERITSVVHHYRDDRSCERVAQLVQRINEEPEVD